MSNRLTYVIAGILLLIVFVLSLLSIRDDTLTFDEVSHIPAGYSYLTQQDYRINPEHPPLIKDIAAIPLLFLPIQFPADHPSWTQEENPVWWHQFEFGSHFLYRAGNNPDDILLAARIPMILILVLLGGFLFTWTRELFGNKGALIALFLFSFSPTLLAHGRLVTTDVGAAAGIFIATYFFLKALKNPSKQTILVAGIVFGLAQLTKFTAVLLFPLFAILVLVRAIVYISRFKDFWKHFARFVGILVLVALVGYALIWAVYQYHTWNYSPERQVRDTEFNLQSFSPPLANVTIWMADKPLLRPAAHYLTGLFMVLQRSSGGNTTYFLGEVSAAGWKTYFPVVYAIKEPLAFFILFMAALLSLAWFVKNPLWYHPLPRAKKWIQNNFAAFSMLVFIVLYWAVTLKSNLNIGVRHLLPVFPFTIALVGGMTAAWLKPPYLKIKGAFLAWLILWQAYSVLAIYPHFLAYFNELIGRPEQGYLYTVDSNLDWGQDLKRLKHWVDSRGIDMIFIDYFGGGNPEYYFKESYSPWWGTRDKKELPKGSYLAVSVSLLQGGRGVAVKGFDQPTDYYLWLNFYTPVAKIGNSIFVYYIE